MRTPPVDGGALAQRIGELLRERSGTSTGSSPRTATLTSARLRALHEPRTAAPSAARMGEIADALPAHYTLRMRCGCRSPPRSSSASWSCWRRSAAVATYGAVTMRRLGDELRLVSRGYLELRLQVSELRHGHSNLLKELRAADQGRPGRVPRFVKFAIDDARRSPPEDSRCRRRSTTCSALEELRSSAEEHALLNQLRARLERVEGEFRADEELFDEVYGPIGDVPPLGRRSRALRAPRERLLRREADDQARPGEPVGGAASCARSRRRCASRRRRTARSGRRCCSP